LKDHKTILFLHGFFASGSDPIASVLREALDGRCRVLSPDLSIHPEKSLDIARAVITGEKPDLLVGNSCGSFYAQMLSPVYRIPALLGNPALDMVSFLKQRLGPKRFKYQRADGIMDFVVDQSLVEEFETVQQHQFDSYDSSFKERVWGLFGEKDAVSFKELFLRYYTTALSFPGGHVPTAEETIGWYVPAIEKML